MNNNIFNTQDVFKNEVVLTESTYNDHIAKKHPEVKSPTEIKDTVEKPHVVYQSQTFAESKIFFRKIGNSVYNKTIVEYNDNNEGIVSTSYHSETISGVGEGRPLYVNYKN